VSAGYQKRLTAGPAVATRPKPALAASRDWRRVGAGAPIRFRRRVGREAFCPFDRRELKDGSGCYSVLEARKDRSIASINFDVCCSATRNARASGHPSAGTT
jgi:hypothetical protein